MAKSTAIGEQLQAKGMLPRNIDFQIALAKFQNAGGEYGVALAMLNAAYGKGSGGQRPFAEGHGASADASRIHDGEKGPKSLAVASRAVPASPSAKNGAGLTATAEKAERSVPRPVPRPKRGLGAIASIQSDIAVSLFDSVTLPDGRKIADVPWSELPKVATEHRRVSRIAMLIYRHAVPAEPNNTARAMLKEEQFAQIIEDAERFNDIV